jgi:hypothetical protein
MVLKVKFVPVPPTGLTIEVEMMFPGDTWLTNVGEDIVAL